MRLLMRLARWAVRLVATVALVLSLLIFLALGVGPRTGRYQTLTVLSGSMAPQIPTGSIVVVTPESATDLRVGQVIAYRIPIGDHHVESHRVVKILMGGPHPVIITKGDANSEPDPWTAQVLDPVVWQVRSAVPHAGRAIIALRGPTTRRILVLGIPALLALIWIRDIWKRRPQRTLDEAVSAVLVEFPTAVLVGDREPSQTGLEIAR